MQSIVVKILDHTADNVAEQIRAVRHAAYLQEAKLLGTIFFPPLEQTVSDIQCSSDRFFGAYLGDVLAGVASIENPQAQLPRSISSVTVAPQYQRRGLARALLRTLLDDMQSQTIIVSTGARNAPALALYADFGFIAFNYRTVGAEQLELVELRRDRLKSVPGDRHES